MHHIPDTVQGLDQCLIMYGGPHIGLLEKEKGDYVWGKVGRKGQFGVTSSCGSLMGCLGYFENDGWPRLFDPLCEDGNGTDL